MTRYTVVWVRSAEDELVEIWLKGDDREEVTAATNAIERELREDAVWKGEELSEGCARSKRLRCESSSQCGSTIESRRS